MPTLVEENKDLSLVVGMRCTDAFACVVGSKNKMTDHAFTADAMVVDDAIHY